MADILFYEKPGCINGEKQKAILRRAGHRLDCIDILSHPWTAEELIPFLASRKPSDIMNHTAPAIKCGQVDPATLTFEQAIALMVSSPILIKRPLIAVEGLKFQGFTNLRLAPYLGEWDGAEDVITCPNLQTLSCDEKRKRDALSLSSGTNNRDD